MARASGVTNFNDPANLALAPGSNLFQTRTATLRLALELGYQLATTRTGTVISGGLRPSMNCEPPGWLPVGRWNFQFGAANIQSFIARRSFDSPPPPIALPSSRFLSFDPNLEIPRVMSGTSRGVEQSLGKSSEHFQWGRRRGRPQALLADRFME